MNNLLWYTDRTRYEEGTSRCARKRYLTYHAGGTGYGFIARRESLPLATGLSVHEGFAQLVAVLRDHNRLPTLQETRVIVASVIGTYVARVEERGYRGILGSDETEETITEQSALIEGLLRAVVLRVLPWLHQTYQVLSIEEERLHFLDCSCGSIALDGAAHIERGCTGKALMLRTDLLARRRNSAQLAYFEVKTTGWESSAWAEQWETKPQLALGTLDTVHRFGGEVSELYIIGLNKGRRQRDRYDADERRRQLSPLCYGYLRPANPPLQNDDWLPAYEWINDRGETKRASKAHRRTGIWRLETSDWPTWRAYLTANPDMTASEFWIQQLPASVLDKVVFILGPMDRQDVQLHSLLGNITGEEERWQDALWALYAGLQQHPWASVEFQAMLDKVVPCSWACRPFGKEHECEFVPVCHRHVGWEDPIGSGHYQPRLPHHQPELEQAIARGLLPEHAAAPEEDE